MWQGPQCPDHRGAKAAPTFSDCSTFRLLARNRTDVWNFPTDTGKRLYDRDNHDHQKQQMHQRRDNRPEKYQNAANSWNCPEYRMHDGGHDVEEKPGTSKNDRLHCIKTHKTVVLFQNVKDDAADEWNTGNRRSHVRRQTRRRRIRARLGSWAWRRRRRSWLLIWHDLHTQKGQSVVKQSRVRGFFSLSLPART